MEIERIALSTWTSSRSDSAVSPFHLPEALEVIDEHAPGELRLWGGYKGDQLVAVFPVFVRERSVGRAVTSPPPSMGVPRLGPVLMPNSPKRRKRERLNKRFVDGVLDALDLENRFTLFRMIGSTAYTDPRPFGWNDYEISPAFTYHVDVDDRSLDDVLASFSRSLRRDIRSFEDVDATVSVEGIDAAEAVYDRLADRYDDQGASLPPSWEFVRDLCQSLGERARTYVVRNPDGEFLSGIVALYSDEAAYFWLGGARATYENVSVNNFLHRAIVEDIASNPPVDGVGTYDLSGANTERLCEYKAKFGGRLVPYYVVESGGATMDLAKRAYGLASR